ncbi:Gfo/Idh/MocA family protein [Streptococcus panodentis]|uniref:Gfo/Idh/MocA family oxidoreductase n=1 Tax=Streptococcus panodentis TaxID=1581472 RepID=A0ABS5AT42_9STRE|nr:Gfo/Idh/MocA family oxidoreductase [Streptococcus panodentis]MBP2619747.1 gfo/Idh/MocA family oxidoreductase [Streptococcus panodentis]
MLKLGIIGTGAISHEFIKAAQLSGGYQLAAVYSRTLTAAERFVKAYEKVALYTDMVEFLSADLDVAYIASPNSLHFSHAKVAILARKHVIVEKPAVSLPAEWAELVKLAAEHQVYVFEAARNYHEEAFATIREFLRDKTVWGASFTYAKYSSKMQALLEGQEPNVFSAKFSGGALMDLGVYTLYAAIGLFGRPEKALYTAQQLPNTVDLNGAGSLIYPDFQVRIQAGKNLNSQLPAEIYTDQGTLTLDGIEFISSAIFQRLDGQEEVLPIEQAAHPMLEESQAFAGVLENGEDRTYADWQQATAAVHDCLFAMRREAGIRFEVDDD